jgi:hypothetical protein
MGPTTSPNQVCSPLGPSHNSRTIISPPDSSAIFNTLHPLSTHNLPISACRPYRRQGWQQWRSERVHRQAQWYWMSDCGRAGAAPPPRMWLAHHVVWCRFMHRVGAAQITLVAQGKGGGCGSVMMRARCVGGVWSLRRRGARARVRIVHSTTR